MSRNGVQWARALGPNPFPSRGLTPLHGKAWGCSPVDDALIVKEEEADGDFCGVEPGGGGGVRGQWLDPPPSLPSSLHPHLGRDSRCMGLLKLAQLLNVVHQVAPGDILHHKIQAILGEEEGRGRVLEARTRPPAGPCQPVRPALEVSRAVFLNGWFLFTRDKHERLGGHPIRNPE